MFVVLWGSIRGEVAVRWDGDERAVVLWKWSKVKLMMGDL